MTEEELEQAKRLLYAENQQRAALCMAEIKAALELHRCALQFVEVRINGNTTESSIRCVALE